MSDEILLVVINFQVYTLLEKWRNFPISVLHFLKEWFDSLFGEIQQFSCGQFEKIAEKHICPFNMKLGYNLYTCQMYRPWWSDLVVLDRAKLAFNLC